MQEVLVRKCFRVFVFLSPLLYAAFLLHTPGWSRSVPDTSEAKPFAPFVPPELSYSSVFEHYHGYQDQEVASWLEANETVGRIGGWRYYLEEAYQSDQHSVTQPENTNLHSGHGGKP